MVVIADKDFEILKQNVSPEVLQSMSVHEDCIVPQWFQKDYFDETEIMNAEMWQRFSEYAQKYNADNFSESVRECIDSFVTFLKKINELKTDERIQEYLVAWKKI